MGIIIVGFALGFRALLQGIEVEEGFNTFGTYNERRSGPFNLRFVDMFHLSIGITALLGFLICSGYYKLDVV